MNSSDITALRAKACEIVAALGAVLDEVASVEEVMRNPSPGKPVADAVVIGAMLESAAEPAGQLTEAAHELGLALDRAKAAARARAVALGRLNETEAAVFGPREGGAS